MKLLLFFGFFLIFHSIHAQEEGITVKDGKVGIGTITPTEDLEVNGLMKVKDTIVSENTLVMTSGLGTSILTDNGLSLKSLSGVDLVQSGYTLGSGKKGNIRLEGRPGSLLMSDSLGWMVGTLPFSTSENVWMEVGDKGTFVRNKLGIDIEDPVRPLHIFSDNAQMRLQSPNTFTEFSHFDGGTGDVAVFDINPNPGASDQQASIRLFRSTNTTGETILQIFRGDNTTASQHTFRGKGNSSVNVSAGNFSIGTTTADAKLEVLADSLGTTAGNRSILQRLWHRNNNADKLDFTSERISAGSTWTTAALQIQRVVDQTKMGYLRFGHSVNDPISIGVGTTEILRATNAGNIGIGTSSFGASSSKVLSLAEGTAPTTSPSDIVQLYVESDSSGSAELKVRDEAGNVTVISDSQVQDLSYDAANREIEISSGSNATLPIFNSTNAGLVPSVSPDTTSYLRADGTWASPNQPTAYLENSLSSDVSMTSSSSWYNGPSITLTPGTWMVTCNLSFEEPSAGNRVWYGRISTGSTHYSGGITKSDSASPQLASLSMTSIITVASNTTIYGQGRSSGSTTYMTATVSLGGTFDVSNITAIKLN